MLLIVKKYLEDVTETEDGFYIGYIDSADHYEQFLAALREAGFYFSVRNSEKFTEDGQFLYKCNKSNVPVPFSGCPFRREKNISYQCAYGSQYYGKVKKLTSEMVLGKTEKKGSRVRHSKKLGCKAKMAAKCIRIYFDYKIPSESSHWRLKREVISNLKHDLLSKKCEVKSLSRYFVKISGAEQHCHSPMHPRAVIRKLLEGTKLKDSLVTVKDEEETESLVETSAIDGGVTFDDPLCLVGEEENVIDLRELCRQKGREVATLSQHLCHDETQLRDLLAALTSVTDRLSESQLQQVSDAAGDGMVGCDEEVVAPSDVLVVENQLCFPSDVSQTVVVQGEGMVGGHVQGPSGDVTDVGGRDLRSGTDPLKLDVVKTDELKLEDGARTDEDGERPRAKDKAHIPSRGAQSKKRRLQKKIFLTPGIIEDFQRRFESSLADMPAGLELHLSNYLEDGSTVYYVLG